LPAVFGRTVASRYGHHGIRQLAELWPRHLTDVSREPFDVCLE
jgi:hypothetical protein